MGESNPVSYSKSIDPTDSSSSNKDTDIPSDNTVEANPVDNSAMSSGEMTIKIPEVVNTHVDFYKNETYMDDLKIYIHYNDASEVSYLSLIDFGRIDIENYYTDGNLLIVKKEYLNTLPATYYNLTIGFDIGDPVNMTFEVHDTEEESVYGEYRLSHYSKKYYTSSPSDFILLVYDTNGAEIKGLFHGKESIDPKYYTLEENGIVVILDKSYMEDIAIGTIFDLGIELDDGVQKKLPVQVLERPIQQGKLENFQYYYSMSNPEDIFIEITWNDSKEVTYLLPVAEKDPKIAKEQYRINDQILRISREVFEGVAIGDYEYAIVYDTGGESMFRITVID